MNAHPIISRMRWPEIMALARNIKPVPRAMTDRLEAAAEEVGRLGILAEIASGACHAD